MNKIQTAPKLINKEKGKCIRCIKVSFFVHFSTNLLFGGKKKDYCRIDQMLHVVREYVFGTFKLF